MSRASLKKLLREAEQERDRLDKSIKSLSKVLRPGPTYGVWNDETGLQAKLDGMKGERQQVLDRIATITTDLAKLEQSDKPDKIKFGHLVIAAVVGAAIVFTAFQGSCSSQPDQNPVQSEQMYAE